MPCPQRADGPELVRALVVGYGSIGERHARILAEEGCDVAVVSGREVDPVRRFGSIAAAVEEHRPGYVVVANRTSEHRASLAELADAGHRGTVLVEKPLCEAPCEPPRTEFEHLFVGYNLRFHPGLSRLRELLDDERALSVQVYAGQYLPDWRPGRDYRTGYSAGRATGGGVLRDLSHEFDYLAWNFGSWRAVAATGGRLSSLEVECEDTVVALLELERCPAVALQLNYLDRQGRRTILVNTDRQTLELDLVSGRLQRTPSAGGDAETFAVDRDITYRAMHRAVLAGRHDDLCTAEQAQDVLRLIEAIERAMATRTWVSR
jgi:predicted dehydrogenase